MKDMANVEKIKLSEEEKAAEIAKAANANPKGGTNVTASTSAEPQYLTAALPTAAPPAAAAEGVPVPSSSSSDAPLHE